MSETEDVTYTRSIQLKRAGFHRQGDGWAKGSLVLTDATMAAMDETAWAASVKIWRQQRR